MFVRNVNTGNYQTEVDGRWFVVDMGSVLEDGAVRAALDERQSERRLPLNEFYACVAQHLDLTYWMSRVGDGAYYL